MSIGNSFFPFWVRAFCTPNIHKKTGFGVKISVLYTKTPFRGSILCNNGFTEGTPRFMARLYLNQVWQYKSISVHYILRVNNTCLNRIIFRQISVYSLHKYICSFVSVLCSVYICVQFLTE